MDTTLTFWNYFVMVTAYEIGTIIVQNDANILVALKRWVWLGLFLAICTYALKTQLRTNLYFIGEVHNLETFAEGVLSYL